MTFQLNFPGADPGEPDSADLVSEELSSEDTSTEDLELSSEDLELQQITERLQELLTKVTTWETTELKPHLDNTQALEDTSSTLYQDYLTKKAALDKEIAVERNSVYSARQELVKMKSQLALLENDKVSLISKKAAQKQLSALQEKLEVIVKSISWWERLYSFQQEDVQFMAGAFDAGRSGVLLANDMGLGKTTTCGTLIPIITALFQEKYDRLPKILWLTKKSLIKSTITEIRRWDPERMLVPIVSTDNAVRQTLVEMAVTNNAVCVANYEAMSSTPALTAVTWDVVFMDEVQRLKGGANPSGPTQIWQNAKFICDKATFLVPLTGTPIMNSPNEMWAYLHLFNPERFPTLRKFTREYTWGWPDVKVNFDHLIKTLKGQVIRRTTLDTGLDLPDATRVFIPLEMTGKQLDLYNQMRKNFFIWLDDQNEKPLTATAIIAQLTRLRQIAVFPGALTFKDPESGIETVLDCQESVKIDEAMDLITELTAVGEQVVVFSAQFNAPLEEIQRRIAKQLPNIKCEVLTGATSKNSDEMEKRFQNNETQVFCINAKTGSEGLNLHKNSEKWSGGASHSIFLDLGWNPANNEQAEKRIHRIGAKQPCFYHILQCVDSVDAFIASILERKSDMINEIVESNSLKGAGAWKDHLAGLI